ncbi:ATP-binding protein [Sediminitomix flava]|uniref:Serine/threonine-protein kinase RsbW n=1 Tax=Sediminitomix flava TaxID=379075 RepID=A0A315ZNA9_SEDFL|nr:ATP-binding protein [Sediminitomix flava]PWJ35989.1 serine/threonine-protein kinase RsbW [Sediminitomix flava]
MQQPLKLKIPSLTDNIRIVESFIDHAREYYKFNDDVYGNIMIAVTESVNNAIVHGNKSDKEKNVHLSVELNEENLSFVVEDEGLGFDYENLPDPTAPENLEKPGGRGIFLIKNLADEVKFSDAGNKVSLVFYLNS